MPSASRSRRVVESASPPPQDEEEDEPQPPSDAEPEDLDDGESDDEHAAAAAGGAPRPRISAADIARARAEQPLDRVVADTRLRAIAADWSLMDRNIKNSIEVLTSAAELMTEFVSCDEDPLGGGLTERTTPLDADMRALLDSEAEVQIRVRILHELRTQLGRGDQIYDAPHRYESTVAAELEKYAQQTARQKYAAKKTYETFREKIWRAGSEDPMPPMLDLIPAEEGDDEDEGDDIVMGGVTLDYKCPLSMRLMTDPLSSSTCPHSYERSVILEYLGTAAAAGRSGRGGGSASVPCPVSGCRAQLAKATLKENPGLKKDVRAFARRQEEREMRRRATQGAGAAVLE